MNRGKEGVGDVYQQETKYRRGAMPGGGLNWAQQPSPYKEYLHSKKQYPLRPVDQEGGRPLWETMGTRRSIRDYSSQFITFSELSQLTWATQGITSGACRFDFRIVPSAGALYPIETYLVANRVEEISPGLYHYNVKETEWSLLKEGHWGPELSRAGLGQEMLEEAACVFIWTAIIERSKWKYRERAYRYIYLDAGHIGQNLYLAATSLGLGCCTVGAFFDQEVDQIIGVDGKNEITIYLGAIGRPQ